jgi:hypothetical protein
MLAIYSSKANYEKGNPLPLVVVPTQIEGAQKMNFSDFQWWCYSDDFQKWLAKNPRDWKAESLDLSDYEELLESNNVSDRKTLSFSEYSKSNRIFEEGEAQPADDNTIKTATKLHYAYNSLLSKGRIRDTLNFSSSGQDIAVFAVLKNEKGEILDEALTAYRMSPKNISGSNLSLVDVTETLPGGPVSETDTAESIYKKIVDNAATVAAWGAISLLIFGAVKGFVLPGAAFVAHGIFNRWWMKRTAKSVIKPLVQKIDDVADIVKTTKNAAEVAKDAGEVGKTSAKVIDIKTGKAVIDAEKAAKTGKVSSKIKSLWGGVRDMATLKNTRAAITSGRAAIDAGKIAGEISRIQKLKNFFTGAKWAFKAGSESARAIRLGKTAVEVAGGAAKTVGLVSAGGASMACGLGEVLLAIDLIGTTWNWLRNNQAPTYNEVKSTTGMHNTFIPSQIDIGNPITICYSQGSATIMGAITDVLVNTEKRTTMEMVKIKEGSDGSLFIVTQIHSESWAKQLAQHDALLLAFPKSTNVKTHWYDNEDLKPQGAFFDGITSGAQFPSLFYGYCGWQELMSAYSSAEDMILKADPDAPEEFSFNFKDLDGNVMNVTGKKVSSDTLSKLTQEQLKVVFGIAEVGGGGMKNESLYTEKINQVFEGKGILKFNDFHDKVKGILENENEDSGDVIELTPEQKSSPAIVAVYNITNKEYANPDLRGKKGYGLGLFEHFFIGGESYRLRDGSEVEISINTDERLDDCRVGIYKYSQEDDSNKEDQNSDKGSGEKSVDSTKDTTKDITKDTTKDITKVENPKKAPDYVGEPVKANIRDISIKTTKDDTTIVDNPVPNGVSIIDRFLTNQEKNILGISNWKYITSAKEIYDSAGNVVEVKLRNGYADFLDKKVRFKSKDGESFKIAKKFIEEVKDRIKIG